MQNMCHQMKARICVACCVSVIVRLFKFEVNYLTLTGHSMKFVLIHDTINVPLQERVGPVFVLRLLKF